MQVRRTLVYMDLDDIPSSATPWDGSTTESISGNVMYIPLFEGTLGTKNYYCKFVETGFYLGFVDKNNTFGLITGDRTIQIYTGNPKLARIRSSSFMFYLSPSRSPVSGNFTYDSIILLLPNKYVKIYLSTSSSLTDSSGVWEYPIYIDTEN